MVIVRVWLPSGLEIVRWVVGVVVWAVVDVDDA